MQDNTKKFITVYIFDITNEVFILTSYSNITKSKWTEFQDLNKELERSVKDKNKVAGVYKFRIVDENNKPYHIFNAGGNDIYGIVYIGSTSSLKSRFRALTRAATKNTKTHSGGRAFYRIKKHNDAFKESYPNAKLQVFIKNYLTMNRLICMK